MAIEFVGRRGVQATTNVGSLALSTTGLAAGIDTEVRVGDFIVLLAGWASTSDGNPGVTDTTLTWTEAADLYANDTNDANLSVNWAQVTTTPPATISLRTAGAAVIQGAVMLVFRGVDTTSPLDVAIATATGTNSPYPSPPSATPATTGAVSVVGGVYAVPSGSGRTVTASPTGYVWGIAFSSTATNPVGGGIIAHKTGLTAGVTETPSAFTISGGADTSSSWAAFTMVLRPAASSSSGNIKVWDGTAWTAKPVKIWNGSSWETKPVKYWNGTTWVTTTY